MSVYTLDNLGDRSHLETDLWRDIEAEQACNDTDPSKRHRTTRRNTIIQSKLGPKKVAVCHALT